MLALAGGVGGRQRGRAGAALATAVAEGHAPAATMGTQLRRQAATELLRIGGWGLSPTAKSFRLVSQWNSIPNEGAHLFTFCFMACEMSLSLVCKVYKMHRMYKM